MENYLIYLIKLFIKFTNFKIIFIILKSRNKLLNNKNYYINILLLFKKKKRLSARGLPMRSPTIVLSTPPAA